MKPVTVGASIESSFSSEGNVCVSAMKFMGVLDPEVMSALERTMGSRKFTRSEMVPILRSVIGESLQRTNASDHGFVNKSAEEFRRDLLRNSKFRDSELQEMIESIDTLGSERISYPMIMDFFIEAARRAPREEEQVGVNRAGVATTSATTKMGLNANLNQSDTTSTKNVDYCMDEHKYEGTRTNLVFVPKHDCFLSCTHRSIERITFPNEMVEKAPRIVTSATDPSATIGTVEYSPTSDSVVVGLHNSRLVIFDFLTGQRKRELQLSDAPTVTLSMRCRTKIGVDEESNDEEVPGEMELIFCGTVNGQIMTVAESGNAALRVVASSRISTHPVAQLFRIPETDLFVAISGKAIAVYDATDSTLKNIVYAKSSISAANLNEFTKSLVFSCVGHSSILFVLPRRGLLHKGSEPLEIRRSRSGPSSSITTKEDRIVRIIDDPSCSSNALTISEAGTAQLWDVSTHTPASLLRDGAESQLHIPGSCLPLLYAASDQTRGAAILGGKSAFVIFSRMIEHDEGVDSPNAPGGEVKLENVLQVLDASRIQVKNDARRHYPADPASEQLVLISAHHVRLFDIKTKSVTTSIPISTTGGIKGKTRGRITHATFGPGRSLLLGTDQGNLLCVSMDRATLGNWTVLGERILLGSVAGVFYSLSKRVVGVVGDRGEISTAEIAPQGDAVVDVAATTVAESDSWASDDDKLAVMHAATSTRADASLQLLNITTLGSRILPAARYYFDQSCLANAAWAKKKDVTSKIGIISGSHSFSASVNDEGSRVSLVVLVSCEDRSQVFAFSVKSEASIAQGLLEITHSLVLMKKLEFTDFHSVPVSLCCSPTWLDGGSDPSVLLAFLDGSFGVFDTQLDMSKLELFRPGAPEELFSTFCFHSGINDFVLVGTGRVTALAQLHRSQAGVQAAATNKGNNTALPPLRPALLCATPIRTNPSPNSTSRTVKSAAPATSLQRKAMPILAPVMPRRAGSAGLHPSMQLTAHLSLLKMPSSASKSRLPPVHATK